MPRKQGKREYLDLKDLLNIPAGLTSIFGLMEICEDEIKQAQARHPAQPDYLWQHGFLLCMPTGNMNHLSDKIYRRHCQELLDRLALGQDTRPGTRAEMLVAFEWCSHAAPLPDDWAFAYSTLFREVFPEQSEWVGIAGHEAYNGQVNEVLTDYRRKLTVETRVVPKEKKQPGLPGMEGLK